MPAKIRVAGITMSSEKSTSTQGFVVLYRWRLQPGREARFVKAWSCATEQLRVHGSLGSRLHRGADGLWYSYAQWPSAKVRDEVFSQGVIDASVAAEMKAAIIERLPEVVLETVADYLEPLCQVSV